MSLAELKEKIVKQVVMSDDEKFLVELDAFMSSQKIKLDDVDAFYERLKGQYGEVLQKLAQ